MLSGERRGCIKALVGRNVAVHPDFLGPTRIFVEFRHGCLTHEIAPLHHLVFLGDGKLMGPPGFFDFQSGGEIVRIRAA